MKDDFVEPPKIKDLILPNSKGEWVVIIYHKDRLLISENVLVEVFLFIFRFLISLLLPRAKLKQNILFSMLNILSF